MKKNFSELANRVRQSSNPQGYDYKQNLINESLGVPHSDVNEYVKLSMFGVPKAYTETMLAAADMVKKTLDKSHGKDVEFKIQGSVATNTHIWNENDVDLVQITSKSNTLDREGLDKAIAETQKYTPEENQNIRKYYNSFSSYKGNTKDDLKEIRIKSEKVLTDTYTSVNISKPKAICVNMQNPKRNVDVVTAVHYNPLEYMKSYHDYKKGIQIYDKDLDIKLPPEYPFWSIKLIQDRNLLVQGRLKKMIRFLKNISYDIRQDIERKLLVSSFDINAICFNIHPDSYSYLHYLELVDILSEELNKLVDSAVYRNSLRSIDKQEFIFYGKEAGKIDDLILMRDAVDLIRRSITYKTKLVS